jgi:hypothetical protein
MEASWLIGGIGSYGANTRNERSPAVIRFGVGVERVVDDGVMKSGSYDMPGAVFTSSADIVIPGCWPGQT